MGRVHGKFIIEKLPEFMGNSLLIPYENLRRPILGTTLGAILGILGLILGVLGGAQSALASKNQASS